MCVFAHDMNASADFYGRMLGAAKGPDPQDASGSRFYFSPLQFVEVLPLSASAGLSRMSCVAWNTVDARALRSYVQAKGVEKLSEATVGSDGSPWFLTYDPEENMVQFVQPGNVGATLPKADPISPRMIHVGYAVKDRAREDRFYREMLGFRPYWHGGMQPNHTGWISIQVPDGTDWLEYMMVGGNPDVDVAKVDANELGVLNHFSLGVPKHGGCSHGPDTG